MKHPLVKCVWNDASSDENEWKEDSELDDGDELVTTVGFLVRKTKNFIWIASSVYEGYNNSRTKIPKGMIKELTTLSEDSSWVKPSS